MLIVHQGVIFLMSAHIDSNGPLNIKLASNIGSPILLARNIVIMHDNKSASDDIGKKSFAW